MSYFKKLKHAALQCSIEYILTYGGLTVACPEVCVWVLHLLFLGYGAPFFLLGQKQRMVIVLYLVFYNTVQNKIDANKNLYIQFNAFQCYN